MKTIDDLKKLESKDFQNREGGSIDGRRPDTIEVFKNVIIAAFKYSNVKDAKAWLERYVTLKGFEIEKSECGDADYSDYPGDWIEACVTIK